MPDPCRDTLLILCDISGYTRFITANAKALSHAYVIITQLMNAILKEARAPLKVIKLEGDAVFFAAFLPENPEGCREAVRTVLRNLDGVFRAFEEKREELVRSNICPCEPCEHANQLRLKMILHRGEAFLHRIGRFEELTGPDVILAHRLLKNSVASDEYVLVTEAVGRELEGGELVPSGETEEHHEGFAPVHAAVYLPPLGLADAAPRALDYTAFGCKAKNILIKIFHGRLMQIGLMRRPQCSNL